MTHLDEVVCVVGAVDADNVFERGAVGWGEQQQFQAFGCSHAEGLADQSEASKLLGEHTARLRLQLAVKRLGHQLLAQQQHVLMYTRARVRTQFTQGRAGQDNYELVENCFGSIVFFSRVITILLRSC